MWQWHTAFGNEYPACGNEYPACGNEYPACGNDNPTSDAMKIILSNKPLILEWMWHCSLIKSDIAIPQGEQW